MKKFFKWSISFVLLLANVTAFAQISPLFYCPNSVTCNNGNCTTPNSGISWKVVQIIPADFTGTLSFQHAMGALPISNFWHTPMNCYYSNYSKGQAIVYIQGSGSYQVGVQLPNTLWGHGTFGPANDECNFTGVNVDPQLCPYILAS